MCTLFVRFLSVVFAVVRFSRYAGQIPTELVQLQSLEKVWLNGNNFSGMSDQRIDTKTFGFIAVVVTLYARQTCGWVPSNLDSTCECVAHFVLLMFRDARHSFLTLDVAAGPIPTQLGQLLRLKHLFLSSNELTGTPYAW